MILSTSVVAFALIASVSTQCFNVGPAVPYPISNSERSFSLEMLKTVLKAHPGQSVFFSPYSTYRALLLTYFSSANQTEAALKRTLQIGDNVTKLQVLRGHVLEKQKISFRQNTTYEFSSSDHLYITNKTRVSCVQDVFSNINPTDFQTNPDLIRESINNLVKDETHGQITDLLPPGAITPQTDLVLLNAAYFKGVWHSKFEVADTKKAIFYGLGQESFVQMMRQEATFRLLASDKLGVQILDMPYTGDDISMIIILPAYSTDAIENVINKLNSIELDVLLSDEEGIDRVVEVQIPKFVVEKTLELKPILEQLGVGDLFTASADLSTLAPEGGVHLDDAIHKAKIEVDENGSVAAAATALFSFRSSRPADPAQFICNHPFIYMIYDKSIRSILFLGVYRGPNV